jgi:alcohol dehydrogenase
MGLTPDTGSEGARAAVNAVKALAQEVKLPSFASLNVNPTDYAKIAEMSARNISTQSNPRPMSEKDYLKVLLVAARE